MEYETLTIEDSMKEEIKQAISKKMDKALRIKDKLKKICGN